MTQEERERERERELTREESEKAGSERGRTSSFETRAPS